MRSDVFADRRHAARCPIDLPIEIIWKNSQFHARTVDVSTEGVAVRVVGPCGTSAGDALMFAFRLQHVLPGQDSRLEGNAVVVRVEQRSDAVLVAFRAECLSTFPVEGAIEAPNSFDI